MDGAAFSEGDEDLIRFDLFDGAPWKEKISDPAKDGTVTVTLSTGKKVTVNSRLLALLRVLADELAREDTNIH